VPIQVPTKEQLEFLQQGAVGIGALATFVQLCFNLGRNFPALLFIGDESHHTMIVQKTLRIHKGGQLQK
jgi:hypothetical protein